MLKAKALIDELIATSCLVTEEERLMYICSGSDEACDNVFSIIDKKMITEKVTIDDAKVLLLSHKIKLEIITQITGCALPSVNLNMKNGANNNIEHSAYGEQKVFDKSQISFIIIPTLQNMITGLIGVSKNTNFPTQKFPMFSQFNNSRRDSGRCRSYKRFQCQLCGKLGNIVSACWYRFDKNLFLHKVSQMFLIKFIMDNLQ